MPTRDRRATLEATLRAIDRDAGGLPIEVVVADDGSRDGTATALRELAPRLDTELRLVEREASGGPGAARNSAIAVAQAPVLLFLGDDVAPRPGLIDAHLGFHREHPESGPSLLGRVVPAPGSDTPFARWLHEYGKQFAFASIELGRPIPAALFNTANASLKRELIERVGRFDERFGVGNDDVELGLRLGRAGLQLSYDPDALAEHDHPTDLEATLRRMRSNGRSYRLLTELHSGQPRPRPPGAGHRLKAATLTAAALARPHRQAARKATWTFLCEQAHREAFWGEEDPSDPAIRVGRQLARIADRDPATRVASC